ncbi:hypothetical protein [Deinococcus yavapaiensis]|uniref:Uncharacterized protein n=1 Tax=Deinococcus yavapaiensis KR-236 TaxID=694435 RepID=A0A318SG84_9DEIO|nr:hypothetical protein [Deinococcus yavapaiensis]PYE48675.1 hypothetical protein DES52_1279 [Deinococcus yavapaiensis KR-236]
MKKIVRFTLLGLGLLVLGACAPAPAGSGISSPIAASALQTVTVRPGQNLFVSTLLNPTYLGIDDSQIDATVPVNWERRDVNNNVQSIETPIDWILLGEPDVPAGWSISLAKAELVRQILSTREDRARGETSIRYRDQVRLVYNVKVPQNAPEDVYNLSFKLRALPKEAQPAILIVNVEKNAK